MKKIPVIFALLLACSIGSVKSQNTAYSFRQITNKQHLALNFIDKLSISPFIDMLSSNSNLAHDNSFIEKSLNENTSVSIAEYGIETISSTQFKYAMLMDIDVEDATNESLYKFIDYWYGTHYRMGGTTKKGIDCSAFSGTLLSSIYSFDVPRTAREQYRICEHLDKQDLMTGDLVFFNTRGGVSHVGVYLTNNHFIHSSSSKGVTISSLDDNYYSRKFIGGGRINQ